MVITPTEVHIAKLIVAAVTLSGVVQTAKHFFLSKLSAKSLVSITTAVTVLAVALNDYLSAHKVGNGTMAGQSLTLLGAVTLAYRYGVGPFYNLLIDAQATRSAAATSAAVAPETAVGEASF